MKIIGAAAGMIFLAFAVALWCKTEKCFELSGTGLQCLGMFLAISGLLDVPKKLKTKSPIDIFQEWWKSRPRQHGHAGGKGAVVLKGFGTLDAHISTWKNRDPNSDIKEQIQVLANNLDILHGDQKKQRTKIYSLQKRQNEAENKSAAELKKVVAKTQDDRKEFHIGGLAWSLVGLVWITAGIVLIKIKLLISIFYPEYFLI